MSGGFLGAPTALNLMPYHYLFVTTQPCHSEAGAYLFLTRLKRIIITLENPRFRFIQGKAFIAACKALELPAYL